MKREVNSIDFGKWIREKIKKSGIKQYDLAEMIPVHKNTLSRYVTGDNYPSLDVCEKICEIFGAELVIREKNDETRAIKGDTEL